ncbi:MAG: hypothetical protein ACD_7C00279G0005 [uncultured bacterium]|nr:MAG: hypothetical protein ACD_7C00279G0005 [uncultured bacterium]HBR79747.1 hypothetical protein [Candidatus Moranbacteria bacterium]
MTNMRDKLKELMGKKILFRQGAIEGPSTDKYYHEIIEVGDDYFVVEGLERGQFTTYAISEVKSISGRT